MTDENFFTASQNWAHVLRMIHPGKMQNQCSSAFCVENPEQESCHEKRFWKHKKSNYVPANAPVANNTNIKDLISRCRSKVRLKKERSCVLLYEATPRPWGEQKGSAYRINKRQSIWVTARKEGDQSLLSLEINKCKSTNQSRRTVQLSQSSNVVYYDKWANEEKRLCSENLNLMTSSDNNKSPKVQHQDHISTQDLQEIKPPTVTQKRRILWRINLLNHQILLLIKCWCKQYDLLSNVSSSYIRVFKREL